jgi:hypothetical protein
LEKNLVQRVVGKILLKIKWDNMKRTKWSKTAKK